MSLDTQTVEPDRDPSTVSLTPADGPFIVLQLGPLGISCDYYNDFDTRAGSLSILERNPGSSFAKSMLLALVPAAQTYTNYLEHRVREWNSDPYLTDSQTSVASQITPETKELVESLDRIALEIRECLSEDKILDLKRYYNLEAAAHLIIYGRPVEPIILKTELVDLND